METKICSKGRNFISVDQYYKQQSARYWCIDGEVMPLGMEWNINDSWLWGELRK